MTNPQAPVARGYRPAQVSADTTATTAATAAPLCASPRCRRDHDDPRPRARRTGTGSRLCGPCRERLADQLAELPGLYAESDEELGGPGRAWMSPRVSGSRTLRLPIDPHTASVRDRALCTLVSWAELVVDERALTAPLAPPARTVPALAAFLRDQLAWLAAHPAAGEAADEIMLLVGTMRRVIDPDPVEPAPVGDCPEAGCHGTVSISSIGSSKAALRGLVCDAGHTLPPSMWLRLGGLRKEVAAV
ncbi:OvmZ protein [Streptomyces sp. NPDC051162]|uniref:OvmZ protein n=1 Tax=Streptomyces sp. NPDC051162 TaxID=3154747 RepID=UPI0034466950